MTVYENISVFITYNTSDDRTTIYDLNKCLTMYNKLVNIAA